MPLISHASNPLSLDDCDPAYSSGVKPEFGIDSSVDATRDITEPSGQRANGIAVETPSRPLIMPSKGSGISVSTVSSLASAGSSCSTPSRSSSGTSLDEYVARMSTLRAANNSTISLASTYSSSSSGSDYRADMWRKYEALLGSEEEGAAGTSIDVVRGVFSRHGGFLSMILITILLFGGAAVGLFVMKRM